VAPILCGSSIKRWLVDSVVRSTLSCRTFFTLGTSCNLGGLFTPAAFSAAPNADRALETPAFHWHCSFICPIALAILFLLDRYKTPLGFFDSQTFLVMTLSLSIKLRISALPVALFWEEMALSGSPVQ